jgi:hypothetical protein
VLHFKVKAEYETRTPPFPVLSTLILLSNSLPLILNCKN